MLARAGRSTSGGTTVLFKSSLWAIGNVVHLTNECWLGYHDNCEISENCDCMCHDTFDWEDADEVIMTTTHECPPSGVGIMPCCGKTPFEVSRFDQITTDKTKVTCTVKADNWLRNEFDRARQRREELP